MYHILFILITTKIQTNKQKQHNIFFFQLLHYISCICTTSKVKDHIVSVMVSVVTSNAADRRFEPRSGQTKDYKLRMCCFSVKHAVLRRKSKEFNVSEWSDMSNSGLLFQ